MKERFAWPLAIIASLCLLYGFFIEVDWIEVTHQTIKAPVASPLRILHLTDLHVRSFGRRERAVLETIATEKPDIILITGDFLTGIRKVDALLELLAQLKAPLGVWAVWGNWEYWSPKEAKDALGRAPGIKLLENESAHPRDDVWIVGLDDLMYGRPDAEKAFRDVGAGGAKIVLFHEPLEFEAIRRPFDLGLAGHTHGGQIRLPFGIAPYLPPGSGPYKEGLFERDGRKLYVSRGVGTSGLHARFLCRPEIAVIDLIP